MSEIKHDRIQCKNCKWLGLGKDILVAVNPFNSADFISGCPGCKQVAPGLEQLCCIQDCKKSIYHVFATKAHGYLFTCHEHHKEFKNT